MSEEFNFNLDLDFEDTAELDSQYDHTPVEEQKVEPLVEDTDKEVNKNDLYSMQDLMVMLMTAGMKQANEKGIYPEKVIQQAMALLKNNNILIKSDEADALKAAMSKFHNADKNAAKERKQTAMDIMKVN